MTLIGYIDRADGQEVCLPCAETKNIERDQEIHAEELVPDIYVYKCSVPKCGRYLTPPTKGALAVLASHRPSAGK